MDMRYSESSIEFEITSRLHAADKFLVQMGVPFAGRIYDAVTIALGEVLVRIGAHLEQLATRRVSDDALRGINPDPCKGCAN